MNMINRAALIKIIIDEGIYLWNCRSTMLRWRVCLWSTPRKWSRKTKNCSCSLPSLGTKTGDQSTKHRTMVRITSSWRARIFGRWWCKYSFLYVMIKGVKWRWKEFVDEKNNIGCRLNEETLQWEYILGKFAFQIKISVIWFLILNTFTTVYLKAQ